MLGFIRRDHYPHPLFHASLFEDTGTALLVPVNTSYVYQDDELERLSIPAAALLNRYPDDPSFFTKTKKAAENALANSQYTHLDSRLITNIRLFLSAVYFRLNDQESKNKYEALIQKLK